MSFGVSDCQTIASSDFHNFIRTLTIFLASSPCLSEARTERGGTRFVKEFAAKRLENASVVALPGVELRLTAEHVLRAAIDNQVFAALHDLERLDGGRAVQAVYIALIRRLPNVIPDRKRLAIDTGFSESSVKRAIGLLERVKLVRVERMKGRSSTYVLADIRASEVASACVAEIRKLARGHSPAQRERGSRATSEPTVDEGRVTSEPGSRLRSEPRVGSLVSHKEAKKIQLKQQGAAAVSSIEQTLRRWGLESASYLVTPGHKQSIPELVENPEAARLIDVTMRSGAWSSGAGVGSKVDYLRRHVGDAVARFSRQTQKREGDVRPQSPPVEPTPPRCEEREAAEAAVAAMTDGEFAQACERLFAERPGLRRLFPECDRASLGLRVLLIEARMKLATKPLALVGDGKLGTVVPEQVRQVERSGRPRERPCLSSEYAGQGSYAATTNKLR